MKILLFCSLFISPLPLFALGGRVIKVIDGDTLILLTSKGRVNVRLAEIDAPEKRQRYGRQSRQLLISLTLNKKVKVTVIEKDRYGRIIGIVRIGKSISKRSINAEMVRRGAAWVYLEYSRDIDLLLFQAAACAERTGLWKSRNPTPPWIYRSLKRFVR